MQNMLKVFVLFSACCCALTAKFADARNGLMIEGVDVNFLPEESLAAFTDAVDDKFVGTLDLHAGRENLLSAINNRKRAWPIIARGAWIAGRYLFSRVSKTYLTRSAGTVTKHYIKKGNMFTNLRHFSKLRPTNVRKIPTKNGTIYMGKIGQNTVKARPWSTYNGRPTLEIINHNKNFIRKFRFDK